MTLEQLIQRELDRGKRVFTLDDVIALTVRYIREKQESAAPALRSDAEIDALLGLTRERGAA